MAITKKTSEDILKRNNLRGVNSALVTFKDFYEATDDIEARLDDLEDGAITLTSLDLDGSADALILDADADTTISAPTDDQIDIEIAGADDFTFTANTFNVLTGSSIALPDGAVGSLPLKFGADGNNGLYGVSDTQLGVAVEGALVGLFDTAGLKTASVGEQVTNAGVSFLSTLYLTQTPQTLTGPGAVNLTTQTTLIVTTGADALTLAAGTTGQIKIITMKTDVGDGTLTPTGLRGGTTITFNDVGDTVVLMYVDSAWIILSNFGCTVA